MSLAVAVFDDASDAVCERLNGADAVAARLRMGTIQLHILKAIRRQHWHDARRAYTV